MKGIFKRLHQKKIRSYISYGLIFFIAAIFTSCNSGKENQNLTTIQWKDKRAIAIVISRSLLPASTEKVQVILVNGQTQVAMLGDFSQEKESVVFTPLIPFTRGLTYEVLVSDQPVGKFEIPSADPADAPTLLTIFPTADSLPENLLKIHLHFSNPMREAQSAKYVTLLKNELDTVGGAFLDLQPELWNENRTMLTLWLDPGRIKRDLIPNQTLGAPLAKHEHYKIVVSSDWQDQQGLKLRKEYSKAFVTNSRDGNSPIPKLWEIKSPENGTLDLLKVNFKEPLDYTLISETISVWSDDEKTIPGKWLIKDNEKMATFSPDQRWSPGSYSLRVETRLEDLSGNNVNRPFDRDITNKETTAKPTRFVYITFRVVE